MKQNEIAIDVTEFQELKAIRMASGKLEVVVVPELGGKIVSLRFLPTGKEWLVGTGKKPLEKVEHGSSFLAADMSGWDECFPTINECEYPIEGVHYGKTLPDHGDVWSIPWDASAHGDTLTCKVMGRALPYDLSRTFRFLDDSILRMEYTARSRSGETLAAFWTAHPQFVATRQTRILLPAETKRVLCVHGGEAFEAGRAYDWPSAEDDSARIDRIGPASAKDCRKFYADGAVDRGWAALHETEDGDHLILEWDAAEVPYFGVWVDEGHFNEFSVCALEPCNGYYDSLTEAVARGTALRIPPHGSVSWHLDVKLGVGAPSNT